MPRVVDHLDHNLGVPASLKQMNGSELVYDADQGKLVTRPRNDPIEQPDRRLEGHSAAGNVHSVTSTAFRAANEELFKTAGDRVSAGAVRLRAFTDAREGLVSHRDAYPAASDQYRALDRILAAITQIRKDTFSRFALDLYDDFENYVVVKMYQGSNLEPGQSGVCVGYCIDWISRKSHVDRGKPSYGVGDRAFPKEQMIKKASDDQLRKGLPRGTGEPPVLEWEHMLRRVDESVKPLQTAYAEAQKVTSHFGRALEAATHDYVGRRSRYYKELKIVDRGMGPREVIVQSDKLPSPDEGERIFRELLRSCVYSSADRTIKEIDRYEKAGKTVAADVMRQALDLILAEEAKKVHMHDVDAMPFLINFPGTTMDGHAVALYIDKARRHFFDPNFGEFEFPLTADQDFLTFANRLWIYYRMWISIRSWQLFHLYYPKPDPP